MCSQDILNPCHVSSMHSTPMLWEKFFSFFPRIWYKLSKPWVLVKDIFCEGLYGIILLQHINHLQHHRCKSAKSTSTIFESIFFNFYPNRKHLFNFDHIEGILFNFEYILRYFSPSTDHTTVAELQNKSLTHLQDIQGISYTIYIMFFMYTPFIYHISYSIYFSFDITFHTKELQNCKINPCLICNISILISFHASLQF